MRPLLMLAALGSALGGGHGHGHGPVDRRPYPTKPSPEAEAETIRRAAEKRRRKGAARLAAAGRTVEAFDLSLGDVARTSLDDVCDSPPERAGDGWRGSITCHACPVQIEGEVDGSAFYFRARWEGWSFGVASTVDAAVAAGWANAEPGSWYAEGDAEGGDFAGSWMKHSEAWRIVEESIAAWRASRAQREGGEP